MEELVQEIKLASEKLVKEYNVKDVTIYIDEGVNEKQVSVQVEI